MVLIFGVSSLKFAAQKMVLVGFNANPTSDLAETLIVTSFSVLLAKTQTRGCFSHVACGLSLTGPVYIVVSYFIEKLVSRGILGRIESGGIYIL